MTSEVVTYYFANFLSTDTLQGTYSSIYPEDIREIPVKILSPKEQEPFIVLVDYLLLLHSLELDFISVKYFDVLLNGCIFNSYFPNELKSANKEILKHLGDLKPITDEMSEEEKLAIIQGV